MFRACFSTPTPSSTCTTGLLSDGQSRRTNQMNTPVGCLSVSSGIGRVPEIVHADNGNPMRGMTLAVFLDSLQVRRSYSRPRCSNDNAYIESWHKTLKYTVGYPFFFPSLKRPGLGTPTSSTGTTQTTNIQALATLLLCSAAPVRQLQSMRAETKPSRTRFSKIPSAGDGGKSGHINATQCSPSTGRRRRPLDDISIIPWRILS